MSRGRKRMRYTITVEQMAAYEKLKEHLQLDRIINNTTIFKEPISGVALDKMTTDKIQATFILWFNSWIAPNLEKL